MFDVSARKYHPKDTTTEIATDKALAASKTALCWWRLTLLFTTPHRKDPLSTLPNDHHTDGSHVAGHKRVFARCIVQTHGMFPRTRLPPISARRSSYAGQCSHRANEYMYCLVGLPAWRFGDVGVGLFIVCISPV